MFWRIGKIAENDWGSALLPKRGRVKEKPALRRKYRLGRLGKRRLPFVLRGGSRSENGGRRKGSEVRLRNKTISGISVSQEKLRVGRILFEDFTKPKDELVRGARVHAGGHFPDVFKKFFF